MIGPATHFYVTLKSILKNYGAHKDLWLFSLVLPRQSVWFGSVGASVAALSNKFVTPHLAFISCLSPAAC